MYTCVKMKCRFVLPQSQREPPLESHPGVRPGEEKEFIHESAKQSCSSTVSNKRERDGRQYISLKKAIKIVPRVMRLPLSCFFGGVFKGGALGGAHTVPKNVPKMNFCSTVFQPNCSRDASRHFNGESPERVLAGLLCPKKKKSS